MNLSKEQFDILCANIFKAYEASNDKNFRHVKYSVKSVHDYMSYGEVDLLSCYVDLFKRAIATVSKSYFCCGVICEDFGTWLNQSSYMDYSGHFIRLRLSPLDCAYKSTHDVFKNVIDEFIKTFYPKNKRDFKLVYQVDSEALAITVFIQNSAYSIGDWYVRI